MWWLFRNRRARFAEGILAAQSIERALTACWRAADAMHAPETPRARYQRVHREVDAFFNRTNDADANLRYILSHEWCRVWLEGWLSQAAGRPVEIPRSFDLQGTLERQLGLR